MEIGKKYKRVITMYVDKSNGKFHDVGRLKRKRKILTCVLHRKI